jgi:branched-chain amino acid transport system ATP-binding protein
VDNGLLSVRSVSRQFGGLWAVEDVSFDLAPGEVVSIVGPNGAGKTTLFNLLSGQLRPTKGDVVFKGRTVTRLSANRRANLGIGRTFQIVRPLRTQTVLENTMVGAFEKHRRRAGAEARAVEVLEALALIDRAEVVAGELTLAEHKRLEMARALAGEPDLLLLDEVMAGLNAAETDQAIAIVQGLAAEGRALLLIEHDLKVVRALAQRVVVLDHGAEIASGKPDAVLDDPTVVEAYLGRRREPADANGTEAELDGHHSPG